MRSARYFLALLLTLVGFAAASPVASASPLGNWVSWGNDPRPGSGCGYSFGTFEQGLASWGGNAIYQSAKSQLGSWSVAAYGSIDSSCIVFNQMQTRVIMMAVNYPGVLRGDGCVYRAKVTATNQGGSVYFSPTLPIVTEWCGQQN